MNYIDRDVLIPPPSRAEENALYGEPLTAMALEIGQQQVCADMNEFGDFIAGADDDVLPCAYFGPISTPRLIAEVLLNPASNADQLCGAARELRERFLAEKASLVREYASRAME